MSDIRLLNIIIVIHHRLDLYTNIIRYCEHLILPSFNMYIIVLFRLTVYVSIAATSMLKGYCGFRDIASI